MLIEENSIQYTLLDSKHLVGNDESILKSIDSKISEFKSYLGTAFVDWFGFFTQSIKDVDEQLENLNN